MKFYRIITSLLAVLIISSCIRIEEEAILTINPQADISAHIRNQKIFATAQINVNPLILSAGNLPILYEFEGELAIYNTISGNIIDAGAFTGGGLSQVYTVSADTTTHERFIVIASGSIIAFADTGNDGDDSNNSILATGDFHSEQEIILSQLFPEQ